MAETVDIAVVGAGAAGLMAAIWAGRAGAGRVVALDGARTLGAKILVAGGGRCNVTHDVVDETAFAGSTRPAIRNVLGRFGVARTVEFFRELGVELKREETGKLFPTTDNARTVLSALLRAAEEARVPVRYPCRVEAIERAGDGFAILRGELRARRVVLATGGRALPKSGSDGAGYAFARSLGHTVTERVFPALVPLTLPREHLLCSLSGLSVEAALEVRSVTGKRVASFTGSTLCTHFGLSGPAVLDVSRYYLDVKASDPGATLVINFLPGCSPAQLDRALVEAAASPLGVARWLTEGAPASGIPDRLARALCELARVDPSLPPNRLTREHRQSLVRTVVEQAVPITGDRGFTHAEVTAGGVPLRELHLDTMESRVCPGLHLCGEILDVDGRIGGYNFQWAWASGFVAGTSAARLSSSSSSPDR